MRIDQVRIKGFRNFGDETIIFHQKTLIIGANDVGKTNLIYALRLLFDKAIPHKKSKTKPNYDIMNAWINR